MKRNNVNTFYVYVFTLKRFVTSLFRFFVCIPDAHAYTFHAV